MKTKTRRHKSAEKPIVRSTGSPSVLTLSETAAYLRVPESAVLQMVQEQGLPGRQIGSDWRFLQSALDLWLCASAKTPGRDALLELAGSWKGDPYLDELVNQIYKSRGHSQSGESN